MVGLFRAVSHVLPRFSCRAVVVLFHGLSSLLCSLPLCRFVGLSCALVVSRGMFVPSLCGVAVLVSVHLRLRVSWKYWGAWGGSIVPYSMAGGHLAVARALLVLSVLLLWLLLFRLGYSFGWPGCVFVCWLCLSLFFSLSLSAGPVLRFCGTFGPLGE